MTNTKTTSSGSDSQLWGQSMGDFLGLWKKEFEPGIWIQVTLATSPGPADVAYNNLALLGTGEEPGTYVSAANEVTVGAAGSELFTLVPDGTLNGLKVMQRIPWDDPKEVERFVEEEGGDPTETQD